MNVWQYITYGKLVTTTSKKQKVKKLIIANKNKKNKSCNGSINAIKATVAGKKGVSEIHKMLLDINPNSKIIDLNSPVGKKLKKQFGHKPDVFLELNEQDNSNNM